MMRIFCGVFFVFSLFGCSAQVAQIHDLKSPLIKDAGFYVPIGADGDYGNRRQVGSGQLVAGQVATTLEAHVHNVVMGTREEGAAAAQVTARQNQMRYVVYPTILDWQNDATQMADIADKLKVKIEIIDVATGEVIGAAVLRNKTGFFTTDKVALQQLLAPPLSTYIAGLFDKSTATAKQN